MNPDNINPFSGVPFPPESADDRYLLGYELGQVHGPDSHLFKRNKLGERSIEFQMGFWDALGDKELTDTAQ